MCTVKSHFSYIFNSTLMFSSLRYVTVNSTDRCLPGATAADFGCKLAEPLDFRHGVWEVAVASVSFPNPQTGKGFSVVVSSNFSRQEIIGSQHHQVLMFTKPVTETAIQVYHAPANLVFHRVIPGLYEYLAFQLYETDGTKLPATRVRDGGLPSVTNVTNIELLFNQLE